MTRYKVGVARHGISHYSAAMPDENGEWVKYEDAQRKVEALEKLVRIYGRIMETGLLEDLSIAIKAARDLGCDV